MDFEDGPIRELRDESLERESKSKIRRVDAELDSREDEAVVADGNASVPSLLDGELFKILTRKPDGSITVKCMLCPFPKVKPGTIRSTGNFICHIKKCHPEMVERMKAKRRAKRTQQEIATPTDSVWIQPIHAYSLAEQDPKPSHATQREVDESIVDFIVDSMLPPSVIDTASFKRLISIASRANATPITSPESNSLLSILHQRHMFAAQKLRETLSAQQFLCSTAHVWRQGNVSFLGMTVHYLERSTLERKSFALAFRRLMGDVTLERVTGVIRKIHRNYDVLDKVTHTITYNDTRLAKAFTKYLELSLSIEPEERYNDLASSKGGAGRQERAIDEDYIYVLQKKFDDAGLPLQEVKCCSHTLYLVACADAELSEMSDSLYKKAHTLSFAKAQALWNHLGQSTTAADRSESIFGSKMPVPDRDNWSTLHGAVSALLKNRDKVNELCASLKLEKFRRADLDFLHEWATVMGPVAAALDVLQNEQMCFLGSVLPALHVLKKKLAGLEGRLAHCGRLREVVLSNIDERFASVLDLTSSSSREYILASISHPRFRTSWIPTHNLEYCKAVFFREFDKIQRNMDSSEDDSVPSTPAKNDDDFFSSLDEDSDQRVSEYENAVQMRALSYLANPRKELAVLHEFPVVLEMFLQYNTALPSSAPVERLLDAGGTSPLTRRHQYSEKALEMAFMLKINT